MTEKAVEWFENRIAVMPESETKEMFCMAISALKKQEEQEAKCCETCRHRNRRGWEEPCNECYMAYVSVSNNEYEDYYEPYTEEES